MKKLMLCVLLGLLLFLLVGCVGSATPHNPMKFDAYNGVNVFDHPKEVERLWWQLDTAGVAKKDNPWEKFVLPYVVDDNLDPWGTYKQPQLFPEGWKPGKDTLMEDTKYHLRLKRIIQRLRRKLNPKVEKSSNLLEEMKRREREYFKRQRRLRREI